MTLTMRNCRQLYKTEQMPNTPKIKPIKLVDDEPLKVIYFCNLFSHTYAFFLLSDCSDLSQNDIIMPKAAKPV